MPNKKVVLFFVVAFSIITVIVLPCLLLIVTGAVSLDFCCFAVDSAGKLYVGKQSRIEVYDGGEMTDSFSAMTSRGYQFTILDDDTILLSTSTVVYSMDLEGNVLDSWRENASDVSNQLYYRRASFVSADGDTYRCRNPFGWKRIVKNGETVVYQITGLSYAVKMLLGLSAITFAILIVLLMLRELKQRRHSQG